MGALSALLNRSPLQSRRRAIAKTLLYRTLMVVVTVAVALLFSDSVGTALNIGIASNVVKTGTYYAHERLWDHSPWGLSDGE